MHSNRLGPINTVCCEEVSTSQGVRYNRFPALYVSIVDVTVLRI